MKGKYIWALVYGCILAAFTAYIALDTFVIERVYAVVEMPDSTQSSAETVGFQQLNGGAGQKSAKNSRGSQSVQKDTLTNTDYQDENISVSLTQYREQNTTIYVADVVLSDAAYLKTALAKDAYGRNVTEKTSDMAERTNAILAVNGDYYGAHESGYVIRNGVLYRSESSGNEEILAIYADGSFEIVSENEITAEALLKKGVVQTLCFGPALVSDGQVCVDENAEVGKAAASNPRTAIGVVDPLHYILVVSDGRTSESEGLSLHELAEFLQGIGVETAYNLDGGGSSTMVFQGVLVNNPTTNGRSIQERSVSDIVYIGY